MGRKEDKAAKKTAMQNLRKARRDLDALTDTTEEAPEYLRRNRAVIAAEKKVRFGRSRGW